LTTTQRDIFISRATEDAWLAQLILHDLEDEGLVCWDASRDIPEGRPWPEEISQSIAASSVVIVLVTPAANESDHVATELALAQKHRRTIVPILVNGCEPGSRHEYVLQRPQWLSLDVRDDDPDLSDLGPVLFNVLAECGATLVSPPGPLTATDLAHLDPTALDFKRTPTDGVRALVATANSRKVPAHHQAAGLLLEQLPALRDLYLVVGAPSAWDGPTDYDRGTADGAALAQRFREHAADLGHPVTVHDPYVVTAVQVVRREQIGLRKLLRGIERVPQTRVDVTGGTVPMSLALKRAAEATGHRVTYTLSRIETPAPAPVAPIESRQATFGGWIDVTDSFVFNRYIERPEQG
jgi:hypothetical protein